MREGEKDDAKTRVLHKDLLLPVSQWFLFEKPKKAKEVVRKSMRDSKKQLIA